MHHLLIFASSIILVTVGHLATDIYLPSMPAIASYFGSTSTMVQLTFSAYLLSYCITPLLVGPISDRVGRKRPIMVGINISLIATLLCIFASNIYVLIFSRFIQGIGLGMVSSVSRAILPDNFQGKELAKYFSYMTIAFPIILAIGPSLGGVIQDHSSWQMVFVFILLYLFALLIFAKLVLPTNTFVKTPEKQSGRHFSVYWPLLKNKKFMLFAGCTVFIFMGISAYLTVGSFLFQKMIGLTATQFGILSVITCGITAILGYVNSRLITVFKPKSLLLLGIPFIISSGTLLIVCHVLDLISASTLLISIILYFVAVPLFFANAGALALSNISGNFGAATALISCLQFMGGVVGSLIVSFSKDSSVMPLAMVFLFVGIGSLLSLYFESSESMVSVKPEQVTS